MLILSDQQLKQILALCNEQSCTFELEQRSYFALRFGGNLYVYLNQCPHLYKRLAKDGFNGFDETMSLIECPSHGAQFTPEKGECVSGPCIGKHLTAFELHQQVDGYCLRPVSTPF